MVNQKIDGRVRACWLAGRENRKKNREMENEVSLSLRNQ